MSLPTQVAGGGGLFPAKGFIWIYPVIAAHEEAILWYTTVAVGHAIVTAPAKVKEDADK
jgi:hypothetical protein